MQKLVIHVVVFLFCIIPLSGQELIILDSGSDHFEVKNTAYLIDTFEKGRLLPENISGSDSLFRPITEQDIGFNRNYDTYWLKFSLKNTFGQDNTWILDFQNWSEAELIRNLPGEEPQIKRTGHLVPFKERDYGVSNKNYFRININQDATHDYYVKLSFRDDHTIVPSNLGFSILSQEYQKNNDAKHIQVISIFLGVLIVMFLYNFIIYYSTKDVNYLYYLMLLAGHIYMTANNAGYIVELLGFVPGFPEWRAEIESFVSAFNAFIIIVFTRNFLNTRNNIRFWDKTLRILLYATPVLFIASNINFQVAGPFIFLESILIVLSLEIVGILSLRKKIPSSGYYLLAYSFFVLGIIIMTLMYAGIIPNTAFTADYSMPLGLTLQMVFFSFALANKINILQDDNKKKTEEIILQLKKNERLQTKVNRELEQKVRERTVDLKEKNNELIVEKKKSDNLLLNILPHEIAEELKNFGFTKARKHEKATLLFSDIAHFTHIAEKMSPEDLVKQLHEYFEKFDSIMDLYGLEKIKTNGDSYMAIGGVPANNDASPAEVVHAGLEMQEFINEIAQEYKNRDQLNFEMRIGVHTGPVVAGVVGSKKFQYDVWGDTVNIASRMESSGEVGKVNISQDTYDQIKSVKDFHFISRGRIMAKNKGEIEMYFVERNN